MIYNFLFFGCAAQHVGSYFPDQGSNLCPLQWKCRVLTTGLPGNSPATFDWILDSVIFTLLGAGCFDMCINILELCSGSQSSYWNCLILSGITLKIHLSGPEKCLV